MAENLKLLQDKILEITLYFDKFCRKYNITYYLMGGSALGAIRHQGFIPWDDDLDVFMTYNNYIKFIDTAKKYLDTEKYYLQEENTEEWPLFFTKLRMNGTTFIEEDTKNRKMHKGFYIDIMCLNNVSSNKIYRYMQYLSARLITAQTIAERGYLTDSFVKKTVMLFSRYLIKGFIKNSLVSFVRSLNNKQTKYVGHFFGRAKFSKTSFPVAFLGKPRYVKFSDALLPVPQEVEKYLSLRYGDNFMEMPDEKTKSQYPSHAAFTDLNVDYKEYESKII